MSIHRRAAKRDANEPQIVEALRNVGAKVCPLNDKGIPDLLVCYYDIYSERYETVLIEVKDGKNKTTDAQNQFMDTWHGDNVHIAYTVEDALKAIGANTQ